MAVIHSIDPDKVIDCLDKPFIKIDKAPCVFTKMMSFLNAVPEHYPDPAKDQRSDSIDVAVARFAFSKQNIRTCRTDCFYVGSRYTPLYIKN